MLEQKEKGKEELWRAVIFQAKEALRENAGIKKAIIIRCCSALEEKGMPTEMICGRVVKELAEFASRKYLFSVIDKKYKDSQKIRAYTHHEKPVEQPLPKDEKKDLEQKDEDPVIWQIPVEQYKIEDVDKYDKAFLQKLVVFLHNRVLTLEARQ